MRAIFIIISTLGFMCVFYMIYTNLNIKHSGNDAVEFKALRFDKCMLEKKWIIQKIEKHESSKHNSFQTVSDLPLDKYGNGLKVDLSKRLITLDGVQFSKQVSLDEEYATLKGNYKFNYHCENGEKRTSHYGFFKLVQPSS